MKARVLSLSLLISLSTPGFGQRFEWASFVEVVSNYSSASSGATTMCRDINGDLIIAGTYAEDFISGNDTVHPVSPGNGSDVYVAKFHADGTPIWITGFGGTWYDDAYAVGSDDDGNVYVSTYIQTAFTVFNDTSVANQTERSIIKLDPSGEFQWQHFISGNQKTGMAVIHRSIYCTVADNTIAKLDADGNVSWQLTPSTGLNNAHLNTLIATPQNDLVALASSVLAAGTITYGTVAINVPNTSHGYYIRLDTNAVALGGAVFGPLAIPSYERVPAAADANGHIYLAATFTGTITLGPATLNSNGAPSHGFLAQFNDADQVIWADSIPTTNCQVHGIAWDASLQKVFLSGQYTAALNMGNGLNLPAAFNGDGFILTFSALDGTPQAVDHWGGPSGTDTGHQLVSDGSGLVFGCGWDYTAPSTFRCKTYSNRVGGVLFAYSQGSDAIAQVAVTFDGTTLTAAPVATEIQWFYNGDTIPGATSNICLPTQSGTYSVVTTNVYGCSSTDLFLYDGIADLSTAGLSAHPIPASDVVWVDLSTIASPQVMELDDALGGKVRSINCGPGRNAVAVGDLPNGVYLLRVPGAMQAVVRLIVSHG